MHSRESIVLLICPEWHRKNLTSWCGFYVCCKAQLSYCQDLTLLHPSFRSYPSSHPTPWSPISGLHFRAFQSHESLWAKVLHALYGQRTCHYAATCCLPSPLANLVSKCIISCTRDQRDSCTDSLRPPGYHHEGGASGVMWNLTSLRHSSATSTTQMAKNIFPPIITKHAGLVSITLISVNTKFERKKWPEVDFFLPCAPNFWFVSKNC